jgi:tight adherence protein C
MILLGVFDVRRSGRLLQGPEDEIVEWAPGADAPFLVRLAATITQRLESHSDAIRNLVRHETSLSARLERQLNQAGRPWGLTGAQLNAITLVGGTGAIALGTIVAVLIGEKWYLGTLLGVVVAIYPRAMVSRMARERSNAIRRAIPGMLDLLVLNAEAGGTARAGLALVAQHMSGELAKEVAVVERRIGVGVDEETALVELATRVGIPELEEMAMNIVTAVRFGAMQYADALEAQAERARLAHRQEIEKFIHQMTIKMLFPIMVFYLPAMMLIFLGPSLLSFTQAL